MNSHPTATKKNRGISWATRHERESLTSALDWSGTHKGRMNDAQLQVHLTTVKPSNKRATRKVKVVWKVVDAGSKSRRREQEWECGIIWAWVAALAAVAGPGRDGAAKASRIGGRDLRTFFPAPEWRVDSEASRFLSQRSGPHQTTSNSFHRGARKNTKRGSWVVESEAVCFSIEYR